MLEAKILPEADLQPPKPILHRSRRCSAGERAARIRVKALSLLLVGAVACGSLGLVNASALPQTTATLKSADKVPVAMQLRLPFCSKQKLLPNGSEAVSTLMLLHYWGIPADLDRVVSALETAPLQKQGAALTGPDPENAFAGNPRKKGSAGCFAPPLVRLFTKFLPPLLRAKDTTGTSLEQLSKENIAAGEPVLIWATASMCAPAETIHWTLPDQSSFDWPVNTVCMVLVGYDDSAYWLEDPSRESGPTRWDKQLVKKRYEALGSHCLVVSKAP